MGAFLVSFAVWIGVRDTLVVEGLNGTLSWDHWVLVFTSGALTYLAITNPMNMTIIVLSQVVFLHISYHEGHNLFGCLIK